MDKYECQVCGYIYDPEQGDPENDIEPGVIFEDLPDDWVCPECGASKDEFEKIEQEVCLEKYFLNIYLDCCHWTAIKAEFTQYTFVFVKL